MQFLCISDEIVTWSFNGGRLPSNAFDEIMSTITYVLEIINVDYDNNGAYSCSGRSNHTYFISEGKLEVTGMKNYYDFINVI